MALITGSPGDDSLEGTAGADTLEGLAGNDFLWAGDGLDYLRGGPGDDTLDGSLGFDLADYSGSLTAIIGSLVTKLVTGEGTDTLVAIEGFIGSPLPDRLTGDDGFNWFVGMGGVDTIDGGDGLDVIDYYLATGAVVVDLAAKTVTGPDGSDVFTNIEGASGTSYDDQLLGDDGANRLRPRRGDDIVDGRGGFDTVDYSSGVSGGVTVDLGAGTATGGGDDDTLISIEAVIGSGFGDTLYGSTAANRLEGGGGDDLLGGRGGQDTFDGGAGFDYVSYGAATASVTANLATGQATVNGTTSTMISVEGFYGGSAADQITGDGNGNVLRGNGGNDTIDGGAGSDYADYRVATGAVTVNLATGSSSGADGSDVLTSIENVWGSNHGDTLIGNSASNVFRPMGGADTVDGGAGDDTVDYRHLASGVAVDLGAGTATTPSASTLRSIEFLYGTQYADQLVGSVYTNIIRGLWGDDSIDGGLGFDLLDYAEATAAIDVDLRDGFAQTSEGRDTFVGIEGIYGTAFADRLVGDAELNIFRGRGGADTIDGGDGQDIADYTDSTGAIVVDFSTGEFSGQVTEDTLISIEGIYGTAFADRLIGDDGDNLFRGAGGVDTLDGGAGIDGIDYRNASGAVSVNLATSAVVDPDGNDLISGFENASGSLFDDALTGDAGTNVLRGRAGDDTIDGGAGIDTARYDGLRAFFDVALTGGLPVTVVDTTGEEGTDQLIGIERMQFIDGNLAFDITPTGDVLDPVTKGEGGNAGKAYRLYQAAFDRTPDEGGVGYWIAQIDAGAKLFDIATGFLESDEFKALYGANPSNQEYTQALYRNVLDRDPDQAGYDYWNEVLELGATTRQQMLVDFSESAENKSNVLPAIQNGVLYELWVD